MSKKAVAELNFQPDGAVLIKRERYTKMKVYYPTLSSWRRLDAVTEDCLITIKNIHVYRIEIKDE